MQKILIIEDNNEVRDNLEDILSLAGYDVQSSSNGRNGIEDTVSFSPDLILCDVMMPQLDGYGVLDILRQRTDTKDIPFVFITAKGDHDDLRRGMNLGADDYVVKPFYKDELLNVIKIRLDRGSSKKSNSQVLPLWGSDDNKKVLERAIVNLFKNANTRVLKRGEAIFRERETVRDIYLIKNGFVKYQRSTEFDKTLIVSVYGENALIGQSEFLNSPTYLHDAIALSNTEIQSVPIHTVKSLLATDSAITQMILLYLSHNFNSASELLLNHAYNSVRKRCAITLLKAHRIFGDTKWPMNREELAQWTGTAKETFIRNLSDFKDSKLIEIKNNQIIILDEKSLEDIPG